MKGIKIIIFALLAFSLNLSAQFKVPNPQPELFVNDYTNTLTEGQKQSILEKIRTFEKASSIQIAIVILNDFQGYEIEDITLAIGRKWGVGQRGLNNGILYLVSPANRKGRIEVGPGVQGDITDAFVNQIQESVKTYYRSGDYYSGIDDIVTNLIAKLKPISWEERQRFKVEQEKQSAANMAAVGDFILNFLLGGGILGLIIWGFVAIRKKIEAQKRELQDLKDTYVNKQRSLKDKKNNFLPYKNVDSVSEAINAIDNLLKFPEAKIKKHLQYMIGQYDALSSSDKLRQAKDDILEYRSFVALKEKINIYIGKVDKDEIALYEKQLNKEQAIFEDKRSVYNKLFEVTTESSSNINKEFRQAKEQLFVLANELQEAYKSDEFIKNNQNQINKWIDQIDVARSAIFHLGTYFNTYISSVDIELEKIAKTKANFLIDLENKVKDQIKKPYVTVGTRNKMNENLDFIKGIYGEWISDKSDLDNDLKFIKKLTLAAALIQQAYNVDFNAYRAEQDRLQKIKEEEERKKREEERKKREEEERERRRKREQEEEDRRRRSSYYSSNDSYSSFSSSSSSSSSDFGGGSFDGGGGSSSW